MPDLCFDVFSIEPRALGFGCLKSEKMSKGLPDSRQDLVDLVKRKNELAVSYNPVYLWQMGTTTPGTNTDHAIALWVSTH